MGSVEEPGYAVCMDQGLLYCQSANDGIKDIVGFGRLLYGHESQLSYRTSAERIVGVDGVEDVHRAM